jgi:PleD family two-component response regulator
LFAHTLRESVRDADVVRLADTALLRAKDEGRDRLVIADDRDSSAVVEPAN